MGDIGGISQAAASNVNTAMTDATNIELQQHANEFNAQQAALQRSWSGGQAQKQMDFNAAQAAKTRTYQTGERVAAQDFSEQMSNTQIQRRMADLKAAGVNPLLAASQLGGASSPTSQGMSGATASAGLPGGAAASGQAAHVIGDPVLSGLAQLKLTNAQAANVKQQTQTEKAETGIREAQEDLWAAQTTPDMVMRRTQALSAHYDLDYAEASMVNEYTNMIRNASSTSDSSTLQARMEAQASVMSTEAQRATNDQLIKMKNAVYGQQATEASNIQAVQGQKYLGVGIAALQAVAQPLSSAAGAVQSGANAASTMKSMALKTFPW